jgi:hypothetical protein
LEADRNVTLLPRLALRVPSVFEQALQHGVAHLDRGNEIGARHVLVAGSRSAKAEPLQGRGHRMRVVLVGAEAAANEVVVGPGWIALEVAVRWQRFRHGFHDLLISRAEPEIGAEGAVAEKQAQQVRVERPLVAAFQLDRRRDRDVPLGGAVPLGEVAAEFVSRFDVRRVASVPTT